MQIIFIISYFMFIVLIMNVLMFFKNDPHKYKNGFYLMYK
jgi:hypothetical protein